jgi:cyclic-di-GMP phosphodiesterase, flagellum assembly factor TipF
MRVSAVFIALSVVVIAVSFGAAAYLALGFSVIEALATAFAAVSILTAVQAFAGRTRERVDTARNIAELSRGTTELAKQVGELGRRVIAVEAALARQREESRTASAPVNTEIELLGGLVQQLAETVAAHEQALSRAAAPPALLQPELRAAAAMAPPAPPPEQAPRLADPAPRAAAQPYSPEPALPDADEAYPLERDTDPEIADAIKDGQVELYLQPIVTLPQRKVRHYEATARLRLHDGSVLAPTDYAVAAESVGLTRQLDELMLLRAAQVARRLTGRSREAALFYGLGAATVCETGFFSQFADFLAVNPTLAPSLVLGVPQLAVATMGPLEQEGMAQLARLGVRFCLDQVSNPEIEPRELGGLGIRFVKAPAGVLLDSETIANATIHTSDLSNLLARFGIDLIVDGIGSENVVVDLLDYEVRFGQGALFGPPRPVRAEVFESSAAPQPAALSNPAPAAAPAPKADERAPLPPGPRRRESEQASQRPGERTPQALAQLARNLMRRA